MHTITPSMRSKHHPHTHLLATSADSLAGRHPRRSKHDGETAIAIVSEQAFIVVERRN